MYRRYIYLIEDETKLAEFTKLLEVTQVDIVEEGSIFETERDSAIVRINEIIRTLDE